MSDLNRSAKNTSRMHLNLEDLIIGGSLVVTGAMLLSHFKKRPDAPRKWRALAIVVMILGFMVAAWDPVFALAFHRT